MHKQFFLIILLLLLLGCQSEDPESQEISIEPTLSVDTPPSPVVTETLATEQLGTEETPIISPEPEITSEPIIEDLPRWYLLSRPGGVGSLAMNVSISPVNSQQIYIALNEGGFLVTDNGGVTWTNIFYSLIEAGNYIPPEDWNPYVLADPLDENSVFVAAGGNLYFSENAGLTWNILLERAALGNFAISNDGQTIYALADLGLFISRDKGQNWELLIERSESYFGPNADGTVAVDSQDTATAYTVFDGKLFVTKSTGREWDSPSFLNNVTAMQVIADRDIPGLAYVLTNEFRCIELQMGVILGD